MNNKWKKFRPLPIKYPGFLLMILLMVALFGKTWSQNIETLEYFFDTDPGHNAGTQVPVSPPVPHLSDFNFNVSISGLNDGFHKLYVRARDEYGVWSFPNNRSFYKNTVGASQLYDLTRIEYFIDTDPGPGNGTNVPFTPGTHIPDLEFNIDISGLQQGFHFLYVRAMDQQGNWSLTNRRSFLKEIVNVSSPLVTLAEYYIDTDPGFGQGTTIPVSPNGSDITLDFNVDITTLPAGFHQLYVRVKDDEGRWSLTTRRSFLKETVNITNKIVNAVEYYFDTDPGHGNGYPVPFTASPNVVITDHIIDITSLADGFHHLFIRAKDETGCWSLTNMRRFFKKQMVAPAPNLVAAEYFIDNDPGFGLGTVIPVPGNSSMEELSFTTDISGLSNGMHRIFVRTMDSLDRWSHTNIYAFYKTGALPELPDIVYAEYFIDSDPGMGSGIQIPVLNPGPDVTDLTFEIDESLLIMGNHMLFMRTRDEAGHWSLTLVDQFCRTAHANFTTNNAWLGNPTSFTDLSTSVTPSTEYFWDVNGDGITDYTYNHGFDHTFPAAGTYNARLILVTPEGCPDTIVKQVNVYTCMEPTNLTVSNITENSAVVQWSPANIETAWNIQFGLSGFTPGNGTIINSIPSTAFTLYNLIQNTSYDFYVQSACQPGSESSWAGPLTFTTLEGAPCVNPTNGGTILEDQTICFGLVPQPLTNMVPATGYSGTLEYKWQISYNDTDYADIPGAIFPDYTPVNPLTTTTWFRRLARVNCNPDWFGAAVSNTIQISVVAREHYRTKASGDWNNPATWEYFNGTQWVDAVDYPSSGSLACPNPLATVQSGHIVNVNNHVEYGNVVVQTGGTLEIQNDVNLGIISGDTLSVYGTLIMHSTALVNGAGNFWLAGGGNMEIGSVEGITVNSNLGNIQVTGFRIYSSGAYYVYNGIADQVTGDGLLQNNAAEVVINNPGFTVTLTGSVVINGDVIIIAGTFNADIYNITLGGNWTNSGIFLPGTGTVIFNSTINVYVSVTNFYNVIFAGSGTVTALGSLTIFGNVTINNYFNAGSYTIYVYGNWTNNGTFEYGTSTVQFMGGGNIFIGGGSFYNIIFAGTGTVTATGSLYFYGNVNINNYFDAGSYTHYVYGNWVNTGNFVYNTSTIQFVGSGNIFLGTGSFYNVVFGGTGTITATGILTFYGNVTINNYFDPGSYNLYVYGNWVNNGTFVYGTSTVNFVGSGNIYIGATYFYNVVFGGTGVIFFNGAITIYGDATITGIVNAGSYTISVVGNWVNSGTFNYGTSTVEFIGNGNVYVSQNDFYNVIFAGTGTFIATGPINFYGDVTINSSFDAGSYTHYIYGNWVNNGTFIYGTSTIYFVGTVNITIGVSNFYNVVFAGTGTTTATGSLTIYGDITINTYFDAGSFAHFIFGNWINNGIFIYGTSTINFVGSGNVYLSENSFYNVIFAGSGTVVATGSITFYGDVTINNYFDAAAFIHYVYGNWIVNGTFIYGTSTIQFVGSGNIYIGISNFYNVIFAGTGTVTATGSLTIWGDVTINNYFNAGDFVHYIYGNWINNGVFVYGTSTITFLGTGIYFIGTNEFYNVVFGSSGTYTATGSITFYGNVVINGYFDAGSFIHYVHGNWEVTGIFIYGTSTIHFVGTGNAFVGSGNFYHVIFAGTGTVTATGSLTIYGNVAINNYFNAGSYIHFIYGNWTNSGTFVYGTSTIHFLGTGNILIGTSEFYHIIFAGTGIITATGTLTIYGDVNISGQFDAAEYDHYVYGNWYNNGIFIHGTSTIHFVGTGNIYLGVNNFYNIVFGGTGTVTANGTLTIYGSVTINNYFDAGTYVHYVYGNWTNTGTFIYGTSTIHFVGTGNILVGTSSFYHIIFAGTGTITATGSLYIYGDITISTQFDAADYDHYIYGNWINNGVFIYGTSTIHFVGTGNIFLGVNNFYNIVFGGTGTITATGTLTIYGSVTINNYFDPGNFVHYVYGNWTNNGTFVYGTSTIHFVGTGNSLVGTSNFYHVIFAGTGTVTATGILYIYGNVTINNQFDAAEYDHYVYGTWINNGTFVHGTSTIHFVGSGNIYLGVNNFYHVVFAGTGTITANGSLTIYGNVVINNHFYGGSYIHYVHGNWTNNGIFVYGTCTVVFNGTVQQVVDGTNESVFYGFTVDNPLGILLNTNITVNYMLTLTLGIITTGNYVFTVIPAGTITGGSQTSYIYGKLVCGFNSLGSRIFPVGTANTYGPMTFSYVTLTGTSLVQVEFNGGVIPGTIPPFINNVGNYYWTISQTGGSLFTFTVTLNVPGFDPTGTVWMLKGDGSVVNTYVTTVPNYTNFEVFNTFGEFTLGEVVCAQPTGLASLENTLTSATLYWEPGYQEQSWRVEYGPAGFTQGTGVGTILNNVTSRPLVLSDLTPETYYEFYVQSVCDDQAMSPFTGPGEFSTFSKELKIKAYLEGPYNAATGLMQTTLNNTGKLPQTQPFQGAPWYYPGTEEVENIPAGVVDWVLIEWRDAPTAATAYRSTIVGRQAAFVKNDGSIVGLDGTSLLQIMNPHVDHHLYIVVQQRNHLAIMTANPPSLSGLVYNWDFTPAANLAYGGTLAQKMLSVGKYGMFSGDGDGNGEINNNDKNYVWKVQVGSSGYFTGDFNLDGQVSSIDKIYKWAPNSGVGSQVPD